MSAALRLAAATLRDDSPGWREIADGGKVRMNRPGGAPAGLVVRPTEEAHCPDCGEALANDPGGSMDLLCRAGCGARFVPDLDSLAAAPEATP